jgi:hypothetical protein
MSTGTSAVMLMLGSSRISAWESSFGLSSPEEGGCEGDAALAGGPDAIFLLPSEAGRPAPPSSWPGGRDSTTTTQATNPRTTTAVTT